MEIQIIIKRTIMSYIIEYIKSNNLKKEVFDDIKHIRLFKKIIRPVELVGDRRG